MPRKSMDHTRLSTIALSVGHEKGVFDRIFSGSAGSGEEPDIVMIDATHLKAHRTACSLAKKGLFPAVSAEPKVA